MGSLSWFIEGAKWVHRSGSLKEQSRWRRSKGEISSDDGKQSEKKRVLESMIEKRESQISLKLMKVG